MASPCPRTLAAGLALLAAACTSDMNITVTRLPAADGVVAAGPHCAPESLDAEQAQTRACVALGEVFVGDTGRSWNCGRERVEVDLVSVACSVGANALQLEPVLTSGCYQARAQLLACPEGEG